MFKIQIFDKISSKGLNKFTPEKYEYASDMKYPDAILVRSHNLNDLVFSESIKAIARAGSGINNIPLEKCSEKGIIVFNTPGANSNAVKELTIMSLILSSRKIVPAILWTKSLIEKNADIKNIIEQGKSNFEGPEIKGKKLGIIGLGAIGVLVAKETHSLGMKVSGYDPFISNDTLNSLAGLITISDDLESLISESDYLTLHIPFNENTRNIINQETFQIMKKGVRIINFSRGELVNTKDISEALKNETVSCYVTDFPDEELLKLDKVIVIPHLGASTPESEENSAMMAVSQLKEFLEKGNIKNSVNFPDCEMPISDKTRLIIANKNIPNIIGQITRILADRKINISNMINKSKKEYAYNILDLELSDKKPHNEIIAELKNIDGIVMARFI